jgi:hypothetical protein
MWTRLCCAVARARCGGPTGLRAAARVAAVRRAGVIRSAPSRPAVLRPPLAGMHAARGAPPRAASVAPLPRRSRRLHRRCSASATSEPAAFTSIPVLDLSLLSAPPAQRAAFLADLRTACHVTGFFYAARHGVPRATCDAALDAAAAFFALPDETKRALDNAASPAFRGYIRTGAENTAGRPDWREQARARGGTGAAAPQCCRR